MIDHFRGSDLLLVLDNCEQVVDTVADFVAQSDLGGTAGLCAVHQPAAARTRRRSNLRPRTIVPRRLGAVVRTTSGRASILVRHAGRCRADRPVRMSLARRAPPRNRARSRPDADDVGRRDRATTRRPLRPAARPDQSPSRSTRALEAAISWSYELLFPDDQRGLWALSCFADGAPLAGVEHVLAALEVPSESAADVIGRLADRSLVAVEFPVDGGAARYRLLDSIRVFAFRAATQRSPS